MDAMVIALENELIASEKRADASSFSLNVRGATQTAFCSDCCGSNGDSCDPNDPYRTSL